MKKETNISRFIYAFFIFPIIIFILYTGVIIYMTWPISEFSMSKSGVFGDSYGALNAFFSGLAFAGIIATILLQRVEIKQNREEFKLTLDAQKETARLSVFTALLDEYNNRLEINNAAMKRIADTSEGISKKLDDENQEIIRNRKKIIIELEEMILK